MVWFIAIIIDQWIQIRFKHWGPVSYESWRLGLFHLHLFQRPSNCPRNPREYQWCSSTQTTGHSQCKTELWKIPHSSSNLGWLGVVILTTGRDSVACCMLSWNWETAPYRVWSWCSSNFISKNRNNSKEGLWLIAYLYIRGMHGVTEYTAWIGCLVSQWAESLQFVA